MQRFLSALVALFLTLIPLGAAEGSVPVINSGDTAWMLTACALVLFMTVPGLALFYAGLVRSKNVLSIIVQCFSLAAAMSVIWVLVGYTLAFTEGTDLIGGLTKFGLLGVGRDSISGFASTIPESVFIVYQMTFFIITPALIIGGTAERMRFPAIFAFTVLWGILCYLPICHQVWGGGWLSKMGLLDYAGGTVVHVTAGVAALVAAIMVGPRKGYPKVAMKPHNLTMTAIGTGMLWVGWFGFNAGSAYSAGADAGMAMLVTQISAAVAAVTWMLIEWIRYGKPTSLGLLTGAVAGLATITPAAGNVGPLGAICIGACAGIGCYLGAVWLKRLAKWDDSLDAFGVHGVGGCIGTILVGVFCASVLGGKPGSNSAGGQIGVQFLGVAIAAAWSAAVTVGLILALRLVMRVRASPEEEDEGLDLSDHDEQGYILN